MKKQIKQILLWARARLEKKIPQNTSLEAEMLLSFLLKKSREYLLAHGEEKISNILFEKYQALVERRSKGEPIAYIIGQKEFFGLNFKVDKSVLIPRPETEMIVEEALAEIKKIKKENILVVDVGTGSGCIAISLAKSLHSCHSRGGGNPEINTNSSWIPCLAGRPRTAMVSGRQANQVGNDNAQRNSINFLGLDISSPSLNIARQNAKFHNLDKKIIFKKSNLLDFLIKIYKLPPAKFAEQFRHTQNRNGSRQATHYLPAGRQAHYLLLTNLPYLPSSWKNNLNSPETVGLGYEPAIALEGGKDGLDLYRKLAEQIKDIIKLQKAFSCYSYLFLDDLDIDKNSKNNKNAKHFSGFPIKSGMTKSDCFSITILCEIDPSQKREIKKIFSFMKNGKIKKDLAGLDRVFIGKIK